MVRRSRKRPYAAGHIPLDYERINGGGWQEEAMDGRTYKVRRIQRGQKDYRCPGCQQIIPIGTAHVVAWTEDTLWGAQAGIDARRHWHNSCWAAADRRRPT